MGVAISGLDNPNILTGQGITQPGKRLEQRGVADASRTWGVLMHLSRLGDIILPVPIVLTLIFWLLRKDKSTFEDDHGREALNFGISLVIYHIVLGITIIGIALYPVLWIVALVNMIRGAVAAGSGEYFRYPITIRFLS